MVDPFKMTETINQPVKRRYLGMKVNAENSKGLRNVSIAISLGITKTPALPTPKTYREHSRAEAIGSRPQLLITNSQSVTASVRDIIIPSHQSSSTAEASLIDVVSGQAQLGALSAPHANLAPTNIFTGMFLSYSNGHGASQAQRLHEPAPAKFRSFLAKLTQTDRKGQNGFVEEHCFILVFWACFNLPHPNVLTMSCPVDLSICAAFMPHVKDI